MEYNRLSAYMRTVLQLYTMGSLCDVPMLTAGVGVVDSVVEVVHPKCILAVLLSLMNVVVLTTTVK